MDYSAAIFYLPEIFLLLQAHISRGMYRSFYDRIETAIHWLNDLATYFSFYWRQFNDRNIFTLIAGTIKNNPSKAIF